MCRCRSSSAVALPLAEMVTVCGLPTVTTLTVLDDPLEVSVTRARGAGQDARCRCGCRCPACLAASIEKSGVRAVPLHTVCMTTWPCSPAAGPAIVLLMTSSPVSYVSVSWMVAVPPGGMVTVVPLSPSRSATLALPPSELTWAVHSDPAGMLS